MSAICTRDSAALVTDALADIYLYIYIQTAVVRTSACVGTAVIPDAVEFSGTHALLV